MFSSQTPLPPLARPQQQQQQQQGPLQPLPRQQQGQQFQTLPASDPPSLREDEDEEDHGQQEGEPVSQASPEAGERASSPPAEETMTPAPSEPPAQPGNAHPASTILAFSGNAPGSPPDQKATENGSSGATGEVDAEAEDDKKREREHKKRSKNWTRPETLKLIRLRTELEPRFAKSGRKTELWDEIAVALQRERITRDAQQCRDKWEKLTAGYKEVRDGVKDREDNPFYDELHPLLSGKSLKRERDRDKDGFGGSGKDTPGKDHSKDVIRDLASSGDGFSKDVDKDGPYRGHVRTREALKDEEDDGDDAEARAPARKKKRGPKYITVTDLAAVQSLLETVVARQQRFFRDLLDSMERKEQLREQIRQEKEDKWRAEERAQRSIFNNAMIVLTQKLVGDRVGSAVLGSVGPLVGSPEGPQGPKRRSKNWKRAEVLQLIKLRGDMDSRFAKSTRRAALWEELAELLAAQGIKRDGKQCREKWDKLMAEYKDVGDGKRDQSESPYFSELTAIIGRPAEAA